MTNTLDERRRIRGLIERAGVAMLMTLDDGSAHAGRPMLPLLLENDPHIYFLTHQSSRKVVHIARHPQIALTITSSNCHIVVAGRAEVLHDSGMIGRLWRPTYRAWFPHGKHDRDAAVLRVAVERVDYWEPPRSSLVRVVQAVKAVLTRRPIDTPMKTLDGL